MQQFQTPSQPTPTSLTPPTPPVPPPSGTREPEYGGFWIRFLAAIIDGILVSLITLPLRILAALRAMTALKPLQTPPFGTLPPEEALGQVGTSLSGVSMATVWISLVILLISWLYYVILTGKYGATLGKMALKIKVVGRDFQKIGYGTAALREIIGKIVSSLVFCLGFLWIAFDPKKQGFHDKIAGTFVIRR